MCKYMYQNMTYPVDYNTANEDCQKIDINGDMGFELDSYNPNVAGSVEFEKFLTSNCCEE